MAADGPAPDALALSRGLLYWHQAGAFWGLQGFIGLKAVCPQILDIEQKVKNFQLSAKVTSERKHLLLPAGSGRIYGLAAAGRGRIYGLAVAG